jgi:hypothetical protein
VGEFERQPHDLFLVIALDNCSDVEKNVNSLVLDCLIFVVEQLIQHSENLNRSFILLDLGALFLH